MRVWSRRFYWIQGSDGRLMTFSQSEPRLVMDLHSVQFTEVELDERSHTFELSSPTAVIHLQAENDTEFRAWMHAIRSVQQQKQQLPSSTGRPPKIPDSNTFAGATDETPSSAKNIQLKADASATQENTASLESFLSTTSVGASARSLAPDTTASGRKPPPRPEDVLQFGFLAVKEVKSVRRGSHHAREYSNAIWRSSRFGLMYNGKLFQWKEHQGQPQEPLEILDVQNSVSNRCYVQSVDESVFHRKFVFQIVCLDGRILYFAALNGMERDAWVHSLKAVSKSVSSDAKVIGHRMHRVLQVRVIEGRGFATSADPYCEVYLGSERKARTNTKPRCNGEPFWREDFVFE